MIVPFMDYVKTDDSLKEISKDKNHFPEDDTRCLKKD
jgi:hypothetical protein